MNFFVSVLWLCGALIWASLGNTWLSALFALNAGIWLAAAILEDF